MDNETTGTPEQTTSPEVEQAKAAHEAAVTAQVEAKKNLDNLNASLVEQRKQFEALKKVLDNAKPSLAVAKALLTKADADVTITRAAYNALVPKAAPAPRAANSTAQADLCSAVVKVLQTSGKPMTVDEIHVALTAAGVQMAGAKPRENLSAYIGRWSKVPASGIESKGRGLWGAVGVTVLEKTYPLNTAEQVEVPAFLSAPAAPAPEVPAFLTATPAGYVDAPPVAEPTVAGTELPEGFPGLQALVDAGYTTVESVIGKTADQLRRIKGVGAETARAIVAALNPSASGV